MKLRRQVFFFVLLFTIFCSTTLAEQTASSAKLRVGFIGSFSGTAQVYGDAARNGFEMALDKLGRDWIEVFYEDDQFTPVKTISAFRRLVDTKSVDVIITVGSTPSNAVAPLAEKAKVPLIAWASDRNVSKDRSYVIRSYPSALAEAGRAAEEAKNKGYKKFFLLMANNDYAQSWKSGFVESVGQKAILVDEDFIADNTDFRSILLKAKGKEGEFVVCLSPGQNGIAAKQIRELGFKSSIFGCEYLYDKAEWKISGGALEGSWFSTVSVKDDFRKKYKERFQNDSVISGSANHYDLAHLFHRTWKEKKQQSFVQDIIASGEIHGAVGTFRVRKKEGDQFFDIPLVIKEI